MESLQIHFKVAVRNFMLLMQAGAWFPRMLVAYRIVVVKMIREAASGCLVQLVSNAEIIPLPFQHDCNQGN